MKITLKAGGSTQMFSLAFHSVSLTHNAGQRRKKKEVRKEEKGWSQADVQVGEPNPSDKMDTEDFCLLLLNCSGATWSCVSVSPTADDKTTQQCCCWMCLCFYLLCTMQRGVNLPRIHINRWTLLLDDDNQQQFYTVMVWVCAATVSLLPTCRERRILRRPS